MIFRVTRKTRLSPHNATRYLQESDEMIARGSVDDLREYGDKIVLSVSASVIACKRKKVEMAFVLAGCALDLMRIAKMAPSDPAFARP